MREKIFHDAGRSKIGSDGDSEDAASRSSEDVCDSVREETDMRADVRARAHQEAVDAAMRRAYEIVVKLEAMQRRGRVVSDDMSEEELVRLGWKGRKVSV